jgi:hypothetical protein
MTEQEFAALASWITNVGLEGGAETALVEGCRAVAAGLPLARTLVLIDTLHPIHEGRAFRWQRDKPTTTVSEYGRSTEGEAAERWRTSPHYRLLAMGESVMRRRITAETQREFSLLSALWEGSITEFVAMINQFSAEGVIGELDCFYTSWMTDREGGFSDAEVVTLERLTPFSALQSRRRRSPASPIPWSKPISGATQDGGCCKAALRGALLIASRRCCGSATRATIRASRTARRPKRSFRCSTTTPTRSSRPSTNIRATF